MDTPKELNASAASQGGEGGLPDGGRLPYPRESLAGRVLAGDSEALERVGRWIASELGSARFWRLRNERPDLRQDAIKRVVESLRKGRFDAGRDLEPYVRGVARMTALQALARLRICREVPSEDDGVRHPSEPTNLVETIHARDLAARAIALLSDEGRSLVHDYFFLGKSYEEIALDRGIPEGTVKSRLFRCLEKVYRQLSPSLDGAGLRERPASRRATSPRGDRSRRPKPKVLP